METPADGAVTGPARIEIEATYFLQASDVTSAARLVAGEMSSGTFTAVPGETPELQDAHLARVISVEPARDHQLGPLPALAIRGSVQHAQNVIVKVGIPVANVGANVPALMATVTGNIYELDSVTGLRLLDLEIPARVRSSFAGPRFGVPGTRAVMDVAERPMFGSIVKPSVGLDARQTAAIVYELAMAGLDFLKDDELVADPPYSRFNSRVDAVTAAVDAAERKTGKRMMYAFNVSDRADRMLEHLEYATERGAGAAMVTLSMVGASAVGQLAATSRIPVHGHRAGWGALTRHPALGMDFSAYQKLWRLTGIDHLHVGGLASKFSESDETVLRSIRACLRPIGDAEDRVLPVLSSAQTARHVPMTLDLADSSDFLMLAGGAIMSHPDGPGGGVAAFHQAYEAWSAGIDACTYSRSHRALALALERA
jgi:ribulose-bisphosphate carboxylase large chain